MAAKKFDKVILLPYAASDVHNDIPGGEAASVYNELFASSEYYQMAGNSLIGRFYVKDNLGLLIIGEGKTSAALYTSILLTDTRFDFVDTKFILFGCCGSAVGIGIPGDIYVITATADMDLGYYADARDLTNKDSHSWFVNKSLESFSNYKLNKDNAKFLYDIAKEFKPQTTDKTVAFLSKTFNNQDWAIRQPKLIFASSVTSDNYWKGFHKHKEAQHIISYYDFEDPYIATDMEDSAVARAFDDLGILDKLFILRYSVNMDVFMNNETPESMWGEGNSAFQEQGFDNFKGLFFVATKAATNILLRFLNS